MINPTSPSLNLGHVIHSKVSIAPFDTHPSQDQPVHDNIKNASQLAELICRDFTAIQVRKLKSGHISSTTDGTNVLQMSILFHY